MPTLVISSGSTLESQIQLQLAFYLNFLILLSKRSASLPSYDQIEAEKQQCLLKPILSFKEDKNQVSLLKIAIYTGQVLQINESRLGGCSLQKDLHFDGG